MRVFITGTAGFIGFHLSRRLLKKGCMVCGYDGITDYYDVNLKKRRHEILKKFKNFIAAEKKLEDVLELERIISGFKPDIIIHLAAQAGVRYSLENPQVYVQSNIVGTFNVLEAARKIDLKHLLIASTSSIYGANQKSPFEETDKADSQLTIYSASKKAVESMAHSYSHLYKIPTTVTRFFTVYGPWGRPDMALFKFVDSILNDKPIDVYNNGEMYRDFTFVDDIVEAIELLLSKIPRCSSENFESCNKSEFAAPFRVVNIGNGQKISLMSFICAIEEKVGIKAKRNYMEMQKGDVYSTWANTSLLESLTGYKPATGYKEGVGMFVDWYRDYYKV